MGSRMFLRSMATATKTVKPPVQLFGVEGTYANALYSASVQDSSVDKTFQGLTKVKNLLAEDAKVNEIVNNPALSKPDRVVLIDTLASSLKLETPIVNFLKVLSENNRLGEFNNIYSNFSQLNDAHNGIVEAKITSAKALDSKILKRLQTAIGKSSFVGDGKTLKLNNTVNPEILGGLVVEVGDRTVDLSISAKVARLNQTLGEAL